MRKSKVKIKKAKINFSSLFNLGLFQMTNNKTNETKAVRAECPDG